VSPSYPTPSEKSMNDNGKLNHAERIYHTRFPCTCRTK